ncbi:Amidase signature (AS) enzyme [Glarea lozoyensis ATCC 20868]|uniref:Amidase signature (AS) enzyme n=1 Tax=Glarea lozoyensis (strain ATCC 20868 / MF5171) TaxID=1116229 RepID=S3CUU6_GLAL2|nr:Amidase signature (AS) enzyme [Glarea lozoyensis ATCC 20868]EPE29415.1 Amidase signature (AS) enzyme [Glarea lozoyensis ATCC 20868]
MATAGNPDGGSSRICSKSLASKQLPHATPENFRNPDRHKGHGSGRENSSFKRFSNISGLKMSFFFAMLVALFALCWLPQSLGLPYANFPKSAIHASYPDLLDASAEELVEGLERRRWNSVDLTKAYILRIKEVNPTLNVVNDINPIALSIAADLDAERASGKVRSRLHGLPMLLKDNIATMDQMNNTAGSYALVGATIPRDSTVAKKLRDAGVILLGKANMSQWAYFRSFNTSSGWSAYGGQVTGAYYPDMDPSGSSSGSSVGSSIGLAWASLGTETSGSIVSPASANNVVGIKPTVGLTSRSLVIPISERQDTVGPMARSVTDAAMLLSIIAGKDPDDNYTLAQPFDSPPDYSKGLKLSSLKGARIGIARNAIGTLGVVDSSAKPILDAFEKAIRVMKKAGAIIIDNANYTAQQEQIDDQDRVLLTVLGADLVSGLPKYLSELTNNPNNITLLNDLLNFTQHSPAEHYPERDTLIWQAALAGPKQSDPEFWEAYQKGLRWSGEGGITGALARFNLDALILPTNYAPDMAAYGGLPVITVPMGSYPQSSIVQKSVWNLAETAPNIPQVSVCRSWDRNGVSRH